MSGLDNPLRRKLESAAEFTPAREVSIFILQNKKWVDVFSGTCTFSYDFSLQEFRVLFRVQNISQPHVYRLQPKIRRKGPKAFVIRAQGVTSDIGEAILAFRFENDQDSFHFQYFMEQRQTHDPQRSHKHNHSLHSSPHFDMGQRSPAPAGLQPSAGPFYNAGQKQSSVTPGTRYSRTPSLRAKQKMRSSGYHSSGFHSGARNLPSKSPSLMSVPTLEGSVRSREQTQFSVLPLTEENLLIHDARMPPRPRKVADILKIST